GFRRQLTNITQNAGTAVTSAVRQVRHTMLGGSVRGQKVIAKMKVLTARPDLINNEIDIYTHTTSFGRDPKLCDVQLYDEDDRSTVSGLHCTLQYESSKDVFYLTDDNSSAGTKINGRPIESNDPILLKDGDEIILGDLFRRGAKLQFLIADVAAAKEASNAFEDDGDMYDPFEPLPAVPISAPSITPASASETVLDHSIDEDGADYLDTYQPPSEDNIDIFDDRNYASNADNRFFDDIEETADEAVEETDETYGRTILDHEAMDEIEASEDYGRTILDHKAMDEVDDDETYGRTILDHEAMDDEDPFTTMAPPHGNAANATILDRGGNDFDFDYSDDEQNNTDNDDWLNDLD
ncbi:MAG: FHA domain-containing protein, partial [Candidatus Promineifilaceae bacterium]